MRPAYPDLADDLRRALEDGREIERRIAQPDAGIADPMHLVRMIPYRTRADAITGVVITFIAMVRGD